MDERDVGVIVFFIFFVLSICFVIWKAHHFHMSVLDLMLGAKPVVVVGDKNAK